MITTGLVVRLGGDTLVPATDSDSPTATGRTDAPAATDAGAEPAADVAVGVAVAVIAFPVAVVAGIGAAAPTPKTDWVFAAGVPGTVVPAVGARIDAELAAGIPTVELTVEVGLVGLADADVEGATLPPVGSPGPAPDGKLGAGARAALVEEPVCVGLVCANAAGAPSRSASPSAGLPMMTASLMAAT